MPNVIPAEVPGPVAGAPGHFPHHDWLTASVKALDLNVPGAWTAFTPAMTSSGTSPVLGTGATQLGRYARIGKLVAVQALIVFGTSGASAGSGSTRLSLPFTMKSMGVGFTDYPVGSVLMRDASGNVACMAMIRGNGTDGLGYCAPVFQAAYPTGTLTAVSFSAPWTWAASDSIGYQLTYETADA